MERCESIAELVRLLIAEIGLNAHQLSLRANLAPATVHRILEGEQEPRWDVLGKILLACGKSWAWLDKHMKRLELVPPPEPGKPGRPRKKARD